MEDLKRSHDEALQAAEQARGAVEQSRMRLQTTLAERTKLMSQLEQAKMQEHVAASHAPGQRAVGARATPRACRRSATRSRRGTPTRSARPSSPRPRSRAGCSRCRRRPWTSPVPRGWTRSGPSMSAGPAAVEGSPPRPRIEQGAPPVPAARRRAARGAAGRASRPAGLTTAGRRVSGPEYPPPSYTGSAGEVDRVGARPAGTPPELPMAGGSAAHYLATGQTTGGAFGLYRWDMGPTPVGPVTALPPQHHRVVLRAERHRPAARRTEWVDAGPGDFFHVPIGGVHGFRNESGEPASMLLLFTPGAPREDYFETLADAARREAMGEDDWTEFYLRHDTFWVDGA